TNNRIKYGNYGQYYTWVLKVISSKYTFFSVLYFQTVLPQTLQRHGKPRIKAVRSLQRTQGAGLSEKHLSRHGFSQREVCLQHKETLVLYRNGSQGRIYRYINSHYFYKP